MFRQRNNKAKCFQDCIVEKTKTEKWMAWGLGERNVGGWRGWVCGWGEVGWSCPGLGIGEQVGEQGWWMGGGPWSENLKPFTLSCTPFSQTECKMSGQCGDRRLSSRIWFGVDRWIQKAYGSRGSNSPSYRITNPPHYLPFVTTCGIITTAGQIDGWPRMKL